MLTMELVISRHGSIFSNITLAIYGGSFITSTIPCRGIIAYDALTKMFWNECSTIQDIFSNIPFWLILSKAERVSSHNNTLVVHPVRKFHDDSVSNCQRPGFNHLENGTIDGIMRYGQMRLTTSYKINSHDALLVITKILTRPQLPTVVQILGKKTA